MPWHDLCCRHKGSRPMVSVPDACLACSQALPPVGQTAMRISRMRTFGYKSTTILAQTAKTIRFCCLIFAFLTAPESVHKWRQGKPTGISQNTACSRKRLTATSLDRQNHFCAKIQMIFWHKNAAFAPQTRLLYNANKPCLTHKCTLIAMQRSLLCNANKASLATKPHFLRHKTPVFPFSRPVGTPGMELPVVKNFYCMHDICI